MTDIFKSADWAREALEREAVMKRGPQFIVSEEAMQAILSDPVAMRELMRPDGIIVVDDPASIPSLEALTNARAWITISSDQQLYEDADCTRFYAGPVIWGTKTVKGIKP